MYAACEDAKMPSTKRNVRGFERHGKVGKERLSLMYAACDSQDAKMPSIKRNVRGFERHGNVGKEGLSLMYAACDSQDAKMFI